MIFMKRKKFFLLFITSLLLIGTAFFIVVYQEQREELLAKSQQIEIQRATLLSVQNFMNAHLDMNAYKQDLVMQQKIVNDLLPEHMEQGTWLEILQAKAFAHKVQINGILPGQAMKNDALYVQPVKMKISCTYFQLVDFLKALEETERFLGAKKLHIRGNDEGKLSCEVDMQIYSMEL